MNEQKRQCEQRLFPRVNVAPGPRHGERHPPKGSRLDRSVLKSHGAVPKARALASPHHLPPESPERVPAVPGDEARTGVGRVVTLRGDGHDQAPVDHAHARVAVVGALHLQPVLPAEAAEGLAAHDLPRARRRCQVLVLPLTIEEPLRLAANDVVELGDGRVARCAHAHAVHGIDADGDGLLPASALDGVRDDGATEVDLGVLRG